MSRVPNGNKRRDRPLAVPIRMAVTVSVPVRSAVSVFDMNAFARGRAGGGNLGIALSVYTKIVIRRRAPLRNQAIGRSEQSVLFDHCVSVWASEVGKTGPFDLEVLEAPLQHVGLASSSALQAATYAGLNWLDGLPVSESRLLQMLYSSYKEVFDGDTVDGFTTGLSGFLNFYGGFAALDTDVRPLRHFPLPAWNYVVAIPRGWASSAFGDEEVKLLMTDGKRLDERDRSSKSRLIHDALLPAIGNRRLRDFGRAVHDIQLLGNKRCEILLHGNRMDTVLEELWKTEVECVFLSALGPAIVLLSERPLDSLAPLFAKLELDATYLGNIDNVGIVMNGTDTPVRQVA
jgi:predicted sugar kinase